MNKCFEKEKNRQSRRYTFGGQMFLPNPQNITEIEKK